MGHKARDAATRRVIPGFPKEAIFTTPEEVDEYFSGDKIVCLRCGKLYKTLGVHLLKIHEMEPDEYRGIYGLPWGHGLSCNSTRELHRELCKELYESGTWIASPKQAEIARSYAPDQRTRQPYREVLAERNLVVMNEGKTGEAAEHRRNAPKRGTPEFRELMRNRPQSEENKQMLRDYWKGRKQTDEHVFKRTGFKRNTKDPLNKEKGI